MELLPFLHYLVQFLGLGFIVSAYLNKIILDIIDVTLWEDEKDILLSII
jgi:hypothetical protein